MQFLTEWISNIILLILLATVLEMLLPNSSMQRYVKMVIGLLLLVVILNPLFSIFSKGTDSLLEAISFPGQFEEQNIEISIEKKKKEIQRAQLAYISEQVAVQLKRQVEEGMMKNFEKQIVDVQVALNNFIEEEDPLNSISNVSVKLISNEKQLDREAGVIQTVALVSINTNKRADPVDDDDFDQNEILNYLASEWVIPKDRIEVFTEGGRADQ